MDLTTKVPNRLSATKEKSSVIAIGQHTLEVTAAEDDVKVNHSTELQLQWALQRRGISLDRCRLID